MMEITKETASGVHPTSPHFKIETTPVVPVISEAKRACGGRVRIAALTDVDTGKEFLDKTVTACGWAKSVRKQGGAGLFFIELTDGSTVKNLQIVVEMAALKPEQLETVSKSGTSFSFRVTGVMKVNPKNATSYEMVVSDPEKHECRVIGESDTKKYPLAKKAHSKEFLREIQHLRPRSYLMGCVMRVRSALAFATHSFFKEHGFVYVHTPIITGADCEGAGEMFQVTTIIPESGCIAQIPKDKNGSVDYKKDFFGKKTFLTVSGQLSVETHCCALSDVYTFGPTFRAEKSHTSRHLAEFWMIEPELAFADLEDNMRCAEAYLRYCVKYCLENHRVDLDWLDKNVESGLVERLSVIANNNFARCGYTEAIDILSQVKDKFVEKDIEWGMDLATEHERYLAEEHYKIPVIVYDYPYKIKAFYMKVGPDGRTVRAMDVLLPRIGEVIGGSQREENLELLDKQIADKGLNKEDYWWYRELRQYGSVPHSGFGLGFERLCMLVTGVENIRDVIPFPRYPGTAEF